jgi:hypothetical protein
MSSQTVALLPRPNSQQKITTSGRAKRPFSVWIGLTGLLITLVCLLPAHAQEPLRIDLRRLPIDLNLQSAYIAEVVDQRPEKGPVGLAYHGIGNRKVPIYLRGGLDTCIYNYLYWTLPRDTSKTPVVIEINQLEVAEQLSPMYQKALLHLEVSFYRQRDSLENRPLLYLAKVSLEEAGADVTMGHESRIRKALFLALDDFNRSWDGLSTAVFTYEEQETINGNDSVYLTLKEQAKADSLRSKTGGNSYINDGSALDNRMPDEEVARISVMFTGFGQTSLRGNHYGGSIYFFQSLPYQTWQFPLVLSLERFSLRPEHQIRDGFAVAEMSYIMPGFMAFRQLSGPVHLGLSLMVPIGEESLVSLTNGQITERSFMGVNAGQGFYVLPTNKVGLSLGLRFVQWFTNSRIYNFDLGLRLEAGLKF